MKRLFAILLSCLLLCGFAFAETDLSSLTAEELAALYADVVFEMNARVIPPETTPVAGYAEEITFRDTQWGMSPDAFRELMANIGLSGRVREGDAWSVELDYEKCGFYYMHQLDGHAYYYAVSPDNMTVAGFKVKEICAYFMETFDDEEVYTDQANTALYKAYYNFGDIMDYPATYEMLKVKLNSIYGIGESYSAQANLGSDRTQYQNTTVWYGANDTMVILLDYHVMYDNGTLYTGYVPMIRIYYGKSNSVQMLKDLENAILREQMEEALSDDSNDGL